MNRTIESRQKRFERMQTRIEMFQNDTKRRVDRMMKHLEISEQKSASMIARRHNITHQRIQRIHKRYERAFHNIHSKMQAINQRRNETLSQMQETSAHIQLRYDFIRQCADEYYHMHSPNGTIEGEREWNYAKHFVGECVPRKMNEHSSSERSDDESEEDGPPKFSEIDINGNGVIEPREVDAAIEKHRLAALDHFHKHHPNMNDTTTREAENHINAEFQKIENCVDRFQNQTGVTHMNETQFGHLVSYVESSCNN